ncbi:MAG TPA: SpoIIE family protein phosphatase [Gemmatimonadales bacterium]|jgi:serine/threonine protein phosphatase PrpC
MPDVGVSSVIQWGVAMRTLPGERESGDLHVVKSVGPGVLAGVVDGLGHGAEAASAARAAVAVLDQHAHEPLLPLLQRCHRALLGTRGVVLSLALFDGAAGSMTWLGVGNVEGVLLNADAAGRARRTTLLTRGGIVGGELPRVRAQVCAVVPGDTVILATDGIKEHFAEELHRDASPQQLADHILSRFGKGTDDALVLVARYVGSGGMMA